MIFVNGEILDLHEWAYSLSCLPLKHALPQEPRSRESRDSKWDELLAAILTFYAKLYSSF